MKNILKIILFGILSINLTLVSAQNPFNKGVNLTGWFAATNARSIAFTKFTKKDFQNIKSLGCDVVRLPIELHHMTSGAPDYTVDPIFYNYLDQVIDWTEELQLNLIIDNHTLEDAKSKSVETPLLKIWPQMARHYKDRSTSVFYEILNEPNTLLAADWAVIQAKVVDSIRVYDTKHTILVTGADWGGISGMLALKKLKDTNLIYSFHFYDPFLFTHQGASWASPSMADLAGVPFPYDAARMPACPTSLKGTWVESSLKTAYKTDGTAAKLKSTLDAAIKYGMTNGVKVYCGELGVFNQNSPELDRIEWYKTVPTYLTEKSIPWTMWDYQGGFGIFNKGSNEVFEYDINRAQAEGMGFTPPPFKQYVLRADTVPFDIYTDFPGDGIIQGGSGDLFSSDVHEGNYSILLTELAQYNNLEFKFKFTKDLSKLVNANYTVDFWVKADSPGSNVVLRFTDTKTTDPKDHPWRRDFTLNSSVVPFDGAWHQVKIQLKKFIDVGSYDGGWFNSTNSFDWKAVDRFQIVAENMALTGKKFWFDDIRINGTPITGISENPGVNQFKAKAFPNPLSSETLIEYHLPAAAKVDVSIFDLTGRKLHTLVNARETAGIHQVRWTTGETNSSNTKQGIYLCRISSVGRNEVIKLIVNNK
jgi:endoglucanase